MRYKNIMNPKNYFSNDDYFISKNFFVFPYIENFQCVLKRTF